MAGVIVEIIIIVDMLKVIILIIIFGNTFLNNAWKNKHQNNPPIIQDTISIFINNSHSILGNKSEMKVSPVEIIRNTIKKQKILQYNDTLSFFRNRNKTKK